MSTRNRRAIWAVPALHREEDLDIERRVTWLELFFDLFFVVTVAELAHDLAAHSTWEGIGEFIVLFLPVWWVWIGITFYNERFESNGLENRFFTFAVMVTVMGLAVNAHDAFGENFDNFVLSYVAGKAIITLLWARASWHVPEFRPTGLRYLVGFTTAMTVAVVATTVDAPARVWLLLAAIAIDIGTPVATLKQQAKLPRFSTSKLPERFGLFVIIVLGEAVVAVASSLAEQETITGPLAIDAILGLAVGFGLWWLYFDFIARRPPKANNRYALAWGYLHMPFVMAVVAGGAGITNVLGAQGELSPDARVLISGALGIALIVMALLELTLQRAELEPTHPTASPALKVATGLVALGIGATPITNPQVLLILLIAAIAINAAYGAFLWFSQNLPDSVEIGQQ